MGLELNALKSILKLLTGAAKVYVAVWAAVYTGVLGHPLGSVVDGFDPPINLALVKQPNVN